MSIDPKVNWDPKVNFELPGEIGPLMAQTMRISIAESQDARYELAMATRDAVRNFEQQLAVVQADTKEVTEKLLSAAKQNIDTTLRYALKLAQAKNVQEYVQIQIEFIRTQVLNLIGQTEELKQSIGRAAMHA